MATDGPQTPSSFGSSVRLRREELGLTQTELAEAADVKQPYIAKIEKGLNKALKPELRERIAIALELDPGHFIAKSGHRSPREPSIDAAVAEQITRLARIAREAGDAEESLAAAKMVVDSIPTESLTPRLAPIRANALLVAGVAQGDLVDATKGHPGIAYLAEARRILTNSDDDALIHSVTFKLGNELRKAEEEKLAEPWLREAVRNAPDVASKQTARIAFIRILNSLENSDEANNQIGLLRAAEDRPELWTPTLHPLAIAEAEARSILSQKRAMRKDVLERLAASENGDMAPQWRIIGRLTHAESLMYNNDDDGAVDLLATVLRDKLISRSLPRLAERGRHLLSINRAADEVIKAELI